MKDEEKTREQLIAELESRRREAIEAKNAEPRIKWVEAALRESEERYRRLLESITDYMYTVKIENGRPVSTTHGPGCLAVTGYTSEYFQMSPHQWWDIIYEEDRNAVFRQAERILSGEAVQPIEHRIIHKDGSIRWIRNTIVSHYDKEGKLIAYDGVIEDITERRMAEEALKESENKFRAIAANANDAIIMMDDETNISYWNPAAERIFEYSKEEAIGKGLHRLIVPMGHHAGFSKGFERFKETGEGPVIGKTLELAGIRKEGTEFYAEHSISAVKIKGKWNAIGMVRDVSERKTAEEGLKASKEYARNIIESSMDMIIAVDKDRRITEFNKAAQETFGYALEEVLGKHVDILYADPSEGLKVHNVTLENGRHLQEIVNRRKNDELFLCLLSSSVLRNTLGAMIGLMGVSHDITRRKRDEEALMESFANLEKAKKEWEATFDSISDPLFIHDREFKIVRANVAYRNAAGAKKFKEFIGRPYYEVFPKMDGPFKMCMKVEELQDEQEEEFSCPVTNRIFKVRFYPIKDVSGGYLYSIHILEDITEAKKAAERLKVEVDVTTHLLMIAEATAHTTDVDRLMEQVVRCGREIMGCDICLSYLWDTGTKVFMPAQALGLSHNQTPLFRTESVDMKVGFVKEAMRKKEPVVKEVWAVHELPIQWIDGIHTLAVIPLIGKKGPLGMIVGIYVGAGLKLAPTIGERDMKVMQGIMHQVSVSLDEARSYKDSVEKAMELSHQIETVQTMHEIDRSILSTMDSQEILETATRMIAKVALCDRATVALIDKEREGFMFAAGFGVTFVPKGGFVPFGDTSATEVVETGRPQFVANLPEIKEGLRPLEKKLVKEGFLSQIRIPLVVKGEIVGVLNIGAKRPSAFTPEDLSTLENLACQIGVALSNARLISDLEELFLGTVKSLSSAIDAKSPWTAGHSERVTKYSLEIGKEMGLSEKELKDLELAGLLHDIGKIGTYELILDKPDRLTEEEQTVVRQHPLKGAEILFPIKQLKDIIPVIRSHHEFYDGTGYPDGLKEEGIPLFARILAVADTVDAMGADRPYRKGRAMNVIVSELKRCSGTQFDPKVVNAFLSILVGEELKTAVS